MPSKKPAILIHADQEIIDKIKFIAKENERSATQEIVYAIKKEIKQYEKENGKIMLIDDFFAERAQKPPKRKKKEE